MDLNTPQGREEARAEAKAMLASPVFEYVMEQAREHYIQVLLREPVGSLTAASAHASMKALPHLHGELQALINDGLFKPKPTRR